MAKALYDLAKKKFLDGDIDLLLHDIKVYLIDAADYTVNLGTDEFADDIAAAAKVATSGNIRTQNTAADCPLHPMAEILPSLGTAGPIGSLLCSWRICSLFDPVGHHAGGIPSNPPV